MSVKTIAVAGLVLIGPCLASCGRPDASGIYVATSDRQVTLVQLIETRDGVVTGRCEQVSVGPNGVVNDRTAGVDGAASGHDLMFTPANAWLGGLAASGAFSWNHLSLSGSGFTLDAPRSSLEAYQSAVARLQSVAAADRQRLAEAQAAQAAAAEQARAARQAADQLAQLQGDTAQLLQDTARMNTAIQDCPDFAGRAAANTVRVEGMLRVAPTLSDFDRNRLSVAANQIVVGTNQIDVARNQYSLGLNGILQQAAPLAQQITAVCASAPAPFADACAAGKTAVDDFKASFERARSAFVPYKQAVQTELERQSAMVRQMGG